MQEASASNVSSYLFSINPEASPLRQPAWKALEDTANRLRGVCVSTMIDTDMPRLEALTLKVNGLLADFSRQQIDLPGINQLVELARQTRLEEAIVALFAGAELNFTEKRPVLHMAMRNPELAPANDRRSVIHTQSRLRDFARSVRSGRQTGSTGKAFERVINIGIGGSDLGPRFVHQALSAQSSGPNVRFVSNIDPSDLETALAGADPETTLFIISSKSFSTPETLSNALAAREWLQGTLGPQGNIGAHFAGVSNAVKLALEFGLSEDKLFALPEWVGGRYSLWSAIGLPLLIAFDEAIVAELHAGARAMDEHFATAPLQSNLPVLLGLIDLWNASFLEIDSLALLPYANALQQLPAWLQQLEMESNGKHCLRDGSTTTCHTSPIIWGGTGTNGQHAFHQLFYQGTRRVALQFITVAPGDDPREQALFESALAQAAALSKGRDLATARATLTDRGLDAHTIEQVAPHLVCAGNQPSTTFLLPSLDAFQLGQLLALYEHKVFVQGWIWGINSFDQYGVELGKEMARSLANPSQHLDPATQRLLDAARQIRN